MLGDVSLTKIDDSHHFWLIFNEWVDDGGEFSHNRETILDAYTRGELYSLYEVETDENYAKERSDLLCKGGGMRYLPCFCIVDQDLQCDIMWVHKRAHKLGLGKKMVQLAGIKYVRVILPEGDDFWVKCAI